MGPEVSAPDRAWIERHRVCWEVQPLKEMVKGHGVQQTGALLTLFARFERPVESGPGLNQIALDVHAHCVKLLQAALASHDESLRVDIEAFDFIAHQRPETHHQIELDTSARLVADLGGVPDAAPLKATLARAERALQDAGVKAQVWEARPDGGLM